MHFNNENTKKIFILIMIMVGIAFFFWDQSRIPALTAKAQMGIRTQIDALAFDVIFPVMDSYGWLKRVLFTSINWAYTNWKGMTFGLLLGAACFSVIRLLPYKNFDNIFLNTLQGTLVGAPLGVCVNCSTPIMQGMQRAGMRLESVLATLSSSPTLNFIVLTMSFSLLPLEFAIAKLVTVLIFILILIPLIVRANQPHTDLSHTQELNLTNSTNAGIFTAKTGSSSCDLPRHKRGLLILSETLIDYLQNLWFIAKIAVPFMLLAGILGAITIETISLESLAAIPMAFWSLILVALIGTLLPVPIALDVLIVSILINAGMPVPFAMTLLFTLGTFSIYPFMIIWRDISKRIALSLFTAVVVLGVISGYAVSEYQNWQSKQIDEQYISALRHGRSKHRVEEKFATFMLEQAKQSCSTTFNTQPEQQRCLKEYLLHRVQKAANNGLCFGLNDKNLRDFCFTQASILVTIKEAINQDKIELCDKIATASIIEYCQAKVVEKSIAGGSQLSRCNVLIDTDKINHCKLQAFFTRVKEYNDTTVCKSFPAGKEHDDCLRMVNMFLHTQSNHYDDCMQLNSSRDQQTCKGIIAKRFISYRGEGQHHCKQLLSPIAYQKCSSLAYTQQATREMQPQACDPITDQRTQQKCRQASVNALVNQLATQYQLDHAEYSSTPIKSDTTHTGTRAADLPPSPLLTATTVIDTEDLHISAIPYAQQVTEGHRGFSTHSYGEHGISGLPKASLLEFKSPFQMGRGIASGDYNNDHWPDLLFASRQGIMLFTNLGQGQFKRTKINTSALDFPDIQLVAFVDINNDGFQDIYAAGYGGKNYLIINDQQGFANATLIKLPNENANLSFASGFADVDNNGQLDIILGNWSFAEQKNFLSNYSQNRLLLNDGKQFTVKTFANELNGETLSSLFSDINQDGFIDLIIANDVSKPDYYYLGKGNGEFDWLSPQDGLLPSTSLNTMSIDSADFNNDLIIDLFSVDMSFSGDSDMAYCDAISAKADQQRCQMILEGKEQIARGNIHWCITLKQANDRSDCITAVIRDRAMQQKKPQDCQKILPEYPLQKHYCENIAQQDPDKESFPIFDYHPQQQSNKLMLGTGKGHFIDVTEAMGVTESYWSWNAKAADLDNDGWQDIYVGNGYGYGEKQREVHSNIFFHNQQGKRFVQHQKSFGLENYTTTLSYTYIDIDLDGDTDIITTGMLEEGRIFINNNAAHNNSISFELRDERGNHFAIGSKVIIRTKAGQQIRELKLSGGFISFDNPVIHFGLGKETQLTTIDIDWPDGHSTHIDSTLSANRHYRIQRKKRNE